MAKNLAAAELGKLGGPARAKSLTPERRREIARNAAKARWDKSPASARTPRQRKEAVA
jgi:hypothetical protein